MDVDIGLAVEGIGKAGGDVDSYINDMMSSETMGVGELSVISVLIADAMGKLEMKKGAATVFTKKEKEVGKELSNIG